MLTRRGGRSLESLVDRARDALAAGLTPPAEWYYDPDVYALEQELGRWWPPTVTPEVRAVQWEFVLQVAGQDVAFLEGVQRGVRSGAGSLGRYQLTEGHRSERPLQAFNTMVARCLASPEAVDRSQPQGWEWP